MAISSIFGVGFSLAREYSYFLCFWGFGEGYIWFVGGGEEVLEYSTF